MSVKGKKLSVLAGIAAGLMLASAGQAAAGYCEDQARAYANSVSPGEQVIGSAVAGGVIGAIAGGIAGGGRGAGQGALIGGGVGAAAGAVSHSVKWHNAYDYAFNQCASSRRAPAVNYAVPAEGSEAWYAACDRKYRSFRYSDATYQPSGGGPRRLCHLP
ncbi:MAG TPA: BA14K family protein [Hyphomicrobiales bacterium]|nr:BA14K family protein [Rhodobiaceae bacterium]HXK53922.1 BA14K family protein [Hyphomicrobiales bacterium]